MEWLTKDDLSEKKKLPSSWTALNKLISKEGFPPGRMVGRNRIWPEKEVDDWLLSRPSAKCSLRGRAKTLVDDARPPGNDKGPGGVTAPAEARKPKPPSSPTNISESAPACQEEAA